jgi:hypothetical protein
VHVSGVSQGWWKSVTFTDCNLVMGDFIHHDKACISTSIFEAVTNTRCITLSVGDNVEMHALSWCIKSPMTRLQSVKVTDFHHPWDTPETCTQTVTRDHIRSRYVEHNRERLHFSLEPLCESLSLLLTATLSWEIYTSWQGVHLYIYLRGCHQH